MLTPEVPVELDDERSALLLEQSGTLLISLDRLLACLHTNRAVAEPVLGSWELWIDPGTQEKYLPITSGEHFVSSIHKRLPRSDLHFAMGVFLALSHVLNESAGLDVHGLKALMKCELRPDPVAVLMLKHHALSRPARPAAHTVH